MNEINYNLLKQPHPLRPVRTSTVIGAGSYLPKTRVRSAEIMQDIGTEKKYGLAHNWMENKMGIKERRMAKPNTKPSELAVKAALDLFNSQPDFNRQLIDAVIFCGIERDMPEPATAHIIQNQLGLKASFTFDVANACYGFCQGVQLANCMISAGTINHALIITGETSTHVAQVIAEKLKQGIQAAEAKHLWGILSVGDAGGAILMGPSDSSRQGFMNFCQLSESQHHGLCQYQRNLDGSIDACMNMGHILARGLKLNKKIHTRMLKELNWKHVDWVLAHQTGRTAFEHIHSLHGVDKNRVVKLYPTLGNITTATLPISFKKLLASDSLKSGDKIAGLFAGSGLVAGQFGYVF